MKRAKVGIVIAVVGVIIVAAGFIPLTRKVTVTEEKIMETTEYKEETRTREETYTEEQVVGEESREEVLLEESIKVTRGSTLGKTFELTEGDIISLKAYSDRDVMLSFSGQGIIYMSLEIGTDIEKEFTIEKTGEHTLLYSSASVIEDAMVDFYVVRIYKAPIVESVEKTRTVEYTEKVPYIVEEPYTEKTARKEQYTLDYLRYAGALLVVVGIAVSVYSGSRKSKHTSKRSKKK